MTPLDVLRIVPVPKKPILDNTCAYNFAGSKFATPLYCKNNYKEIIDDIQAPKDTNLCVLNPANLFNHSLSIPVTPPAINASSNLKKFLFLPWIPPIDAFYT